MEWKLNAPEKLNTVDLEMIDLMSAELRKWKSQPESRPRVFVMSGVGGKAFCAGGEIMSLYKAYMGLGVDKSILTDFFQRDYLLDYTLSQLRDTR